MIEIVLNDRLGKKVRVSVMLWYARHVRERVPSQHGVARSRMKSGLERGQPARAVVGTHHEPVREGPPDSRRYARNSQKSLSVPC